MRRTLVCVVLGAAVLLCGCPNGQTYTTARALEENKFQQTAGMEFVSFDLDPNCDVVVDPGCDTTDAILDEVFIPVPFPFYGIRVGVNEYIDFGAKFSTSGSLALELKVNFLRTPYFDMAIMPGFTTAFLVGYATLPVLFSINFGRQVTLTLAPKASWGIVWSDFDRGSDGLLVGGFASLQIRFNENIGITPAFELQRYIAGSSEFDNPSFQFFTFGLAVHFGGSPDYGWDPEPPPQQPAGPGYYQQPQPQPQPQQQPYYGPTPPPGY